MEQDKNRWSYWSSKGAIVALILLLCVAAFDFIVVGLMGGGEFLGVITIFSFLILVFLYLVYLFLGIPVILKSQSLKSNQAASGKRAIWLGLKLGLIPFSIGTTLVLYELFQWLRLGYGGSNWYVAAILTLAFTLFAILIGWIIGKIKFKSQ